MLNISSEQENSVDCLITPEEMLKIVGNREMIGENW